MLSTKKIGGKLGKYIIFIFLAVFCVVLSVTTSGFLTEKNIINVLRQVSYNGVIAVGMTFVIITGNIDLSVGGVVGLAAIVACDLCSSRRIPPDHPDTGGVGDRRTGRFDQRHRHRIRSCASSSL